jgi:prepilin-type N-terminal cleavage/methylation domain-containing protein
VSAGVSHLTKGNTVLANIHRIQRNRELNGEQGFTLIELLIVIVVLGILAAIVVFALGGVTSSSAAAACTTEAQSVNVAIAAEQATSPSVAPLLVSGTAAGDLVPAYLSTVPSSSFYTITVGTTSPYTTMVSLNNSGDPGYTAAEVSGAVTPQQYNGVLGSGAFQYPATPASNYASKGICAGA